MKIIFLSVIFSMVLFSACTQRLSPEKIKAEVLASEFIYEEASFPSCHASTIIETENGLLASWFGGTHEKHPDVCIYTSEKTLEQWSAPALVADGIMNDTLRHPCWNPVLFKKDNGDVVLYYKVGPNPREWWGLYKISTDDGKSWSESILIPDHLLGPIKNKPEQLKDGTILYPTSYETPEKWAIYVETSDQNLDNWEKTEIDNNGFNAIQPTVLFHKGGRIQLLCRSKEKKIVETWSDNQGKTWTPLTATSLPNNNSGIDAVTLDNGLHLLICNPIEKGRNKLSVLASADGKNWSTLIILEDQPKGEFSYPAIIQGKDGTIHITYTYNREKIKYVHLAIQKK
ncbi:MAG: sialidase [Bacteroidetes bacterium GWF2_42_66]|nr:MAG: sialidase [Bacteroidetes bacterium GWA2_42_15]OFY00382.1 MAG: sialidase [Bacteroidetes bacterium GWE2_42_39]OFY47048.1 MAG: sialidase [Bacteroidetes bacterium GWF2_42_66]HAZ04316.1 sialidase [Marinilabiliales bacterium]HBL76790.1 sialidase [Prolixibacteraceae bacterium]